MVQKPEKGRYLTLEDVRISYKAKDDTVHITSADTDIPNGDFYLTLKRGTPTETAVRQLLIREGLIQDDEAEEQTRLVKPNPIKNLVTDFVAGESSAHKVKLSGRPGSGKTVSNQLALYYALRLKATSVIITTDSSYETMANNILGKDNVNVNKFSKMAPGMLNSFSAIDNEGEAREVMANTIIRLFANSRSISNEVQTLIGALTAKVTSRGSIGEVFEHMKDYKMASEFDSMITAIDSFPNIEALINRSEKSPGQPLLQEGKVNIIDLSDLAFYATSSFNGGIAQTIWNLITLTLFSELKEKVLDPARHRELPKFIFSDKNVFHRSPQIGSYDYMPAIENLAKKADISTWEVTSNYRSRNANSKETNFFYFQEEVLHDFENSVYSQKNPFAIRREDMTEFSDALNELETGEFIRAFDGEWNKIEKVKLIKGYTDSIITSEETAPQKTFKSFFEV